jgi:hypothetical protein
MALSLHKNVSNHWVEKGECVVETFLIALGQLMFVALVYAMAYKSGYNAAHDKAVSTIREFSGPVNDLLDKLNETLYEAPEIEDEE